MALWPVSTTQAVAMKIIGGPGNFSGGKNSNLFENIFDCVLDL